MAQSQLALYNMALSCVGADYTIESVSEESVPAETCELWYESVRQTVLRAAHWNSAKRAARLVLETERDTAEDWVTTDPEPGYVYSFALPTNMLAARYLTTFGQFSLGYDNDKKIISTNEETPILMYTVDVTDLTLLEPDLYQALAYTLAAHIARPLSGKRELIRDNFAAAQAFVDEARARTANEMYRLFTAMPESLHVRGYTNFPVNAPYIYPYGSLHSGTGAPTL